MKRLLLLFVAFGIAESAAAQATYPLTFGGNRDAGTNVTAIPSKVRATPDGGTVIGGVFDNNIDIEPGSGVVLYQTGFGGLLRASFIASYSSTGMLRFGVPLIPTPEGAEAVLTDITVDTAGNVYAIGVFSGTLGTITASDTNAGGDLFLVSYDPAGALRWAFSIDGPNILTDYKVVVDALGSVWISGGLSRGTPTDFDPGAGTTVLTATPGGGGVFGSGSVAFIASYASATGAFQTANLVEGPGQINTGEIAARPGGGVVLYGGFFGDIDFGLTAGANTIRNVDGIDLFVASYDATPALVNVFVLEASTSGESVAENIAVAADGSIAISGEGDSTIDFDPGPGVAIEDFFFNGGTYLASYAPDGTFRFVARGFAGNDIAFNPPGDVITITGDYSFSGNDFDPGPGVVTLPTNGGQDNAFIVGLGAVAGDFRFASGLVSSDPGETIGFALDYTPGGSIIVAGTFIGTTDFDPGDGVTTVVSTRAFSEDFFITQLSSTGAFQPAGGTPNEGGADSDVSQFSVSPNPARSGAARIVLETTGRTRVSIYDALGREVAVLFDADAGIGRDLDLRVPGSLAPGAYVVRAVADGRSRALPVTVIR